MEIDWIRYIAAVIGLFVFGFGVEFSVTDKPYSFILLALGIVLVLGATALR